MSSKRKPYYHLKLSATAFWSMPVRYLKEFFGKESYLEKPYEEGRSEMHQDVPDDNWHLPPWNRPSFYDWSFPPFPPFPKLSPFKLPPFPLPVERPGVTLPVHTRPHGIGKVKWPGRPRIGESPEWLPPFAVQSLCSIRYNGPDCLDEGKSATVFVASNTSGSFIWGAEVSDPRYLQAANVGFAGDYRGAGVKFELTAQGSPNPAVDVEVCFFMAEVRIRTIRNYPSSYRSEGIGMENRPDTTTSRELLVSKCGCVTITVPCDPCLGNEYIIPSIELDQGTLAPGTAPCASSSSTKTLTVLNGAGPYTWSVSGTGFCLAYGVTSGPANVLKADDTACGVATVTITDYCGNSCYCEVRSTAGLWCTLAEYYGAATDVPCLLEGYAAIAQLIRGKYKQDETHSGGGGSCVAACFPCAPTLTTCMANPQACIGLDSWYTNAHTICSKSCVIENCDYYGSAGCIAAFHNSFSRHGMEWKCTC